MYSMRGGKEITSNEDLIDGREVADRIAYLEDEIDRAEISEDNGAKPQLNEDGTVKVDMATCGTCGKSWNDALMSEYTPAPSGRCPYEYVHEEIAELKALQDLAGEISEGEALIRDSYFETYARQLAEDLGILDTHSQWPFTCIDWKQAAEELQADYSSVEFDGVTYWVRA